MVIATALKNRYAGHQSMSEAEGNWGGVMSGLSRVIRLLPGLETCWGGGGGGGGGRGGVEEGGDCCRLPLHGPLTSIK